MFLGHYGVSFAAKAMRPSIPLWVLFIAVQLIDVLWAVFVWLGIERVRIVPGITASNPLDLYYMPYTHSLIGAAAWSIVAWLLCRIWRRGIGTDGAAMVGAAVFSHWLLDFVVHGSDLPLYDDAAKVGLGLWNYPVAAFGLEVALMLGGLALYLRTSEPRGGTAAVLGFAVVLVVAHTIAFFGAPPTSASLAAAMALGSYILMAAIAGWLDAKRHEISANRPE